MKCPVCDVTLSISSRDGVEIDFCPQCRGVWLDRGELDKIIDRVAATTIPAPAPPPAPAPRPDDRDRARDQRDRYRDDHDDRYRDDRYRDDRYPKKSKKKKATSFLEDIFDL
jgi:Zn-finger nucleic acid-binding protein